MDDSLPSRRDDAAIALFAVVVLAIMAGRSFFTTLNAPAVPSHPEMIAAAGDVRNPGTYLLEGPEVTVAQVVKAAGGLRSGLSSGLPAEMASRPVRSGQTIHLQAFPQESLEVSVEAMPAAARLTLGEKLNVNASSEEELMLVPQMRAGFAAAIVNHRRRACWRSLAELETVAGIGPKTVEKWQPYLEAVDCVTGGTND